MRKGHRNRPQYQSSCSQPAEALIQEVVTDNEDYIAELDETAKNVLAILFHHLSDKINLRFEQFHQEAAEAAEQNQHLEALLSEASCKLEAALAENAEVKAELQELVGAVVAREGELEAELGETRGEAAAAKEEAVALQGEQRKVQQLLEAYDCRLREVEEEKLQVGQCLGREEGKRRQLEGKLVEVQEQLVQLSLKYQRIERSYDELSQSLESREEKIKHLNKIIEESEYMSSLSPHSRRRIDTQISEEEEPSLNSQHSHRIRKTLNEEQLPLMRLSQSYLPNEKSFKSISLEEEQPELEILSKGSVEVVSERRTKKGGKAVLSHQKKPSKELLSLKKEIEKPKTSVPLSRKECSLAVKSKLSSIFKDRMQYRSEKDGQFELRVEELKERLRAREAVISKLSSELSFLRAVRSEPVVIASNAREVKNSMALRKLLAEVQELHRVTRELTLRKSAAEEQLQEERERCSYYKAEYRKVYENYLLKNAESAAYSEQLSQLEGEVSAREGREGSAGKDEFEDLSQKLNNLARDHEHKFESSEEGNCRKKDYYSIQNVYLADRSDLDLTLENDRKLLPNNLCESAEHSPAKAELNEHSQQLEEFALELEEIKLKEGNNQGEHTERLLLSELMQTSRRQNSLTHFQLFFSDHTPKPLQLVSYGCLAHNPPRDRNLAIHPLEPLLVPPIPKEYSLMHCCAISIAPKEKKEVCVGWEEVSVDQEIQTETTTEDHGVMCTPTYSDCATGIDILTTQEHTNTVSAQVVSVAVGERVGLAEYGFSSWVASSDYGFSSEISTKEVGISSTVSMQDTSINTSLSTHSAEVQTLSLSQQHCAAQAVPACRQWQQQTERQLTLAHFNLFHHQITKSTLSPAHSYSICIQPTKPISYLHSAVVSLQIQPQVRKESAGRQQCKDALKLNLSFLQEKRGKQQLPVDDDCASDFQSFSSFTSVQQQQEMGLQCHPQASLSQIHSGRTRSSSQQLHSHRSDRLDNEKRVCAARGCRAIKESMISQNSSASEQSAKKGEQLMQPKTATHTPAVEITAKAFQSPVGEKHKQSGLSRKELAVVQDYFYQLEGLCEAELVVGKVGEYDFHNNLYVFEAEKEGRSDKFVTWRGKIIRFSSKTEFMELLNYPQSCKTFRGSSVSLGNCEFRISGNKLQVHRLNKRRCFKGEMQNGEWSISKTWTYRTH